MQELEALVESLDFTRNKYKMGISAHLSTLVSLTPWEIGLPKRDHVIARQLYLSIHLKSNSLIYLSGIYGKYLSIWTGRSMETLQAQIS